MPSNVPRGRILIVDDEPSNCTLLTEGLSPKGYECRAASGGIEAINILEHERFDAVISDLRMPGVSGLALLEVARAKYPQMSFLMATGVDNVRVGVEAMKLGADDYVVKPFRLEAVAIAVERALDKKRLELEVETYRERLDEMVEQRTQQLQSAVPSIRQTYEEIPKTYDETLLALGAALALKHNQTYEHAHRVTHYSLEIARALDCTAEQSSQIERGACLHDLGKIGIPDGIMLKPDKLTPEEVAVMQTHVRIGYDLVCHIPFLAEAAEIVLTHHERFDGTGYPRGLKENDIPLGARIVAVANAFDVMVWDQPYRKARSFDEAVAEIRRCSGTKFDPKVVAAFLDWVQTHGDPRKRL